MLKNMVALVTGGAGSLGMATCKRLVEEGCMVTMIDLDKSRGKEVAASLGGKAVFHAGDVTSEEDVSNVVNTIRKQHGKLNILVNCASFSVTKVLYNPNAKRPVDLDRVISSLKVNIGGTLNATRLALDLMVDSPLDKDNLRGVVINTSGFGAYDGQFGQTVMSASWGAISSITLPLCRELGPVGIRVMGIAPGLMQSRLTDFMSQKLQSGLQMFIPSPKRFGRPEEFADLVVNIILNKYLNGEVIRLDAGLRMNISA